MKIAKQDTYGIEVVGPDNQVRRFIRAGDPIPPHLVDVPKDDIIVRDAGDVEVQSAATGDDADGDESGSGKRSGSRRSS